MGLLMSQTPASAMVITSRSGNTTVITPPERYELCKSDAEIQALQNSFGLIRVSSTPTKAAMHPGWPETLISLVTSAYTVRSSLTSPSEQHITVHFAVSLVWTLIQNISWTISFVAIEKEKATAGWLNALTWTSTSAVWFALRARQEVLVSTLLLLITCFQIGGSSAVSGGRQDGSLGSIAYNVTDLNGCVPYNGTHYLQQGTRSHAFYLIQVAELGVAGIFVSPFFFCALGQCCSSDVSDYEAESNADVWALVVAGAQFLLYFPVLVFEFVIAGKGRPVVISGNCLLVELDPKLGFLDSKIEVWWKVLSGITGL